LLLPLLLTLRALGPAAGQKNRSFSRRHAPLPHPR